MSDSEHPDSPPVVDLDESELAGELRAIPTLEQLTTAELRTAVAMLKIDTDETVRALQGAGIRSEIIATALVELADRELRRAGFTNGALADVALIVGAAAEETDGYEGTHDG